MIFGGAGDVHTLYTVNPLTGAETLVGDTGRNFVGDIDFAVPEPATLILLGLGLIGVAATRPSRIEVADS